jgi:polyribonucleotide nucleotidyltransferase
MVECGSSEVLKKIMVEALNIGHEAIKQIIGLQKELFSRIKPVKKSPRHRRRTSNLPRKLRNSFGGTRRCSRYKKHPRWKATLESMPQGQGGGKISRSPTTSKLGLIKRSFDELKERIFRDQILNKRQRPDKRRFDEIRPIWIETGLLRERMVPRFSLAAKPRRSSRRRWARPMMNSAWICLKAKPTGDFCFTTTSRRFRSAKLAG